MVPFNPSSLFDFLVGFGIFVPCFVQYLLSRPLRDQELVFDGEFGGISESVE